MARIQFARILFLFIFLCILFGSCFYDLDKEQITEQSSEFSQKDRIFGYTDVNFEDLTSPKEIESGAHFILYESLQESPYERKYWYRIWDKDSNVVLEGGTTWKMPIVNESGDIVSISFNLGTLASYFKFYDVKNNLLSPCYLNVLAQNDSEICYFDNESRCLKICDAFYPDTICYDIQRDFFEAALPIEEIQFSDNCINFSYLNENGEEVSERVYLE